MSVTPQPRPRLHSLPRSVFHHHRSLDHCVTLSLSRKVLICWTVSSGASSTMKCPLLPPFNANLCWVCKNVRRNIINGWITDALGTCHVEHLRSRTNGQGDRRSFRCGAVTRTVDLGAVCWGAAGDIHHLNGARISELMFRLGSAVSAYIQLGAVVSCSGASHFSQESTYNHRRLSPGILVIRLRGIAGRTPKGLLILVETLIYHRHSC